MNFLVIACVLGACSHSGNAGWHFQHNSDGACLAGVEGSFSAAVMSALCDRKISKEKKAIVSLATGCAVGLGGYLAESMSYNQPKPSLIQKIKNFFNFAKIKN